MRFTSYSSPNWITAIGLAAVAVVAGCDSATPSAEGESCLRTADCVADLSCVSQVCVPNAAATPRAAKAGEHCVTTNDCAMNLVCASNACIDPETSLLGGMGESCASGTDCGPDLACVFARCLPENVKLSPSDKQCEIIECNRNADCCEPLNGACQDLKTECEEGDAWSCLSFREDCACRFRCQDNLCEYARACSDRSDCYDANEPYCRAGLCAECTKDEHCTEGSSCKAGRCDKPCEHDYECASLQVCEEGECTDAGCKSDRQCANLTGVAWATCVDTTCTVSCANDAECWSSVGPDHVCQQGSCLPIGCGSNADCQSYRDAVSQDRPNARSVCR